MGHHEYGYDDYSNWDADEDEEGYDGYEDFDCGWTHQLGQLCDDAGAESCSFFCPHYRTMINALKTHPNIPPTWAHPEQPEYWESNDGE